MCPNINLLKTYKVYPRKLDFNYMRDQFFLYVYLNPFKPFDRPKKYKIQGKEYCFAYEPVYIGKGTGAGYRQHQHINSFLKGNENNRFKRDVLETISKGMADSAAKHATTKPWNWKEYQESYIIILETFQDPKSLLKFEIDSINTIGTLFDKSGPLANKIKNAFTYENLPTGGGPLL